MSTSKVPKDTRAGRVRNQGNAEPRARGRFADAYPRIRADILGGSLKPGTRLPFDQLRAAYGVGLSPLRESLMKLAAEGLVALEEMKGFTVAPISIEDLADITRMRKELEGLALRLSIENGDDAWEAAVISAQHQLLKAKKTREDGGVAADWECQHRAFHQALISACNSPRLLRFCATLYEQSDRYRKLSVHYLTAPRDDVAEHAALADAVLARKPHEATRLIQRHFEGTMEALLSEKYEIQDQ